MKVAQAAYPMTVTVEELNAQHKSYIGHGGPMHVGVQEWMHKGLGHFEDIYGTVVSTHYVVEDVDTIVDETFEGNYELSISIVVVGFVNSEHEYTVSTNDNWPADIEEQLKVVLSDLSVDGITDFDFSGMKRGPSWTEFK